MKRESRLPEILKSLHHAWPTNQEAEAMAEAVTLTYTNWRGETAQRIILPIRVWFG